MPAPICSMPHTRPVKDRGQKHRDESSEVLASGYSCHSGSGGGRFTPAAMYALP
jgi:hypothetical protein